MVHRVGALQQLQEAKPPGYLLENTYMCHSRFQIVTSLRHHTAEARQCRWSQQAWLIGCHRIVYSNQVGRGRILSKHMKVNSARLYWRGWFTNARNVDRGGDAAWNKGAKRGCERRSS